jgi:hypothetical protein
LLCSCGADSSAREMSQSLRLLRPPTKLVSASSESVPLCTIVESSIHTSRENPAMASLLMGVRRRYIEYDNL